MMKRGLLVALVMPLGLLMLLVPLRVARGAYWLGFNYDPEYPYLLNSVNLAEFRGPGHVDHPGTTAQELGALVVSLAHRCVGTGTLRADVLRRPELYLNIFNIVLVAVFVVCQVMLGLTFYNYSKSAFCTWLMQGSFLFSTWTLFALTWARPEPLLLSVILVLLLLLIKAIAQPQWHESPRAALWFGVVVGLGLATKYNFLPLGIVPLLALPSWKRRCLYGAVSVATFGVAVLPALPHFALACQWLGKLASHSGVHGGGDAGFVNSSVFAGLLRTVRFAPTLWAELAATVALLCLVWRSDKFSRENHGQRTTWNVVLGLCAAQVVLLLMVARSPTPHYLIPGLALLGPMGALVYWLSAPCLGLNQRWVRVAVAAAIVILFVPKYRFTYHLVSTGREAQLQTHDVVAREYADQVVLQTYRCSSQASALFFGNEAADRRYSQDLEQLYPRNVFSDLKCAGGFTSFCRPVALDALQELARTGRLLWQTSLCDHKPWNPLTQNIAYEVLYANDVEGVFRVTGLGAVKKAHQGLAQE